MVHRGFTLLEMATTVAALVIVLGLMISMARHVREESSQQLTAELLHRLDQLMGQYIARNGGLLPEVLQIVPADDAADQLPLDEEEIHRLARLNNQQWTQMLRNEGLLGELVSELTPANYDRSTTRDAWGGLIVLMLRQNPQIGMAPHDRFFFFSAGPDRQYLSRGDNLYSYETRN